MMRLLLLLLAACGTGLLGLHLAICGLLMILIMIYYPSEASGLDNWVVEKIKGRSKSESQGDFTWGACSSPPRRRSPRRPTRW